MLDVFFAELLEVHPGEDTDVVYIGRKLLDLDASLIGLRESLLGDLAGYPQPLHHRPVACDSDAPLLLQVLYAETEEALVEVDVIGPDGPLCQDPAVDAQERKVEVAAAHIADEDVAFGPCFVRQGIGNGCCRRRLDQVYGVEPGPLARLEERLPLVLAETSRNCDHSISDCEAEVSLCNAPEVN
mmetsp:Transcript_40186/g.90707  ORF Transcript_40186/g.90707 Transcript_40186/m.90707 type:complete len:185 (-) Transcript_40186:13-567(-)